jgi:hypothetical protein
MAVYEVYFGFAVFWLFHCAEQLFINETNSQIKRTPRKAGFFVLTQFLSAELIEPHSFCSSLHHCGHCLAAHPVDIVDKA